MAQKQITEKMAQTTRLLQRGLLTIYQCEQEMNDAILTGVLNMELSDDEKITVARKLKRRMWRMLLETTK